MKKLPLYASLLILLSSPQLSAKELSMAHCAPAWCSSGAKLNPTESMICQFPELQMADQLLNQVYQQYRDALQGEPRQKLIKAQQQWRVNDRDSLTARHELLATILERVMELNFMSSVVNNP